MAVLSAPTNTPTLDGAVIGCTTDDTSGIAYAMVRTDRQWYSVANGDSQELADADTATILAQDITAPELVWADTDVDLTTIELTVTGLDARLDPANPYYVGWVHEEDADITGPVISAISSGTPTGNAATITWTTDEPATSSVEYGETAGLGTTEPATPDATLRTSHSVALSGLTSETLHYYDVTSADAAANSTTESGTPFTTADISSPVITNVSSGTPGDTTATITWTTDELATSVVDYGLTTGYGGNESDATLVTSHSVALTGLTDGETYHYRVTSVDASSNSSVDTDRTFTTAASAAGGDFYTVIAPYSFDRLGSQSCQDSNGDTVVVAADDIECHPLGDWDGSSWSDAGGLSEGVLTEGDRSNLIEWTEALSNWSVPGNATVTDGAATLRGRPASRVGSNGAVAQLRITTPSIDALAEDSRIEMKLLLQGDTLTNCSVALRNITLNAFVNIDTIIMDGPGSAARTDFVNITGLSTTESTHFTAIYNSVPAGTVLQMYFWPSGVAATEGSTFATMASLEIGGAFGSSYIKCDGAGRTRPNTVMAATLAELSLSPITNNTSGQVKVRPQFNDDDDRTGYTTIMEIRGDAANYIRWSYHNSLNELWFYKRENNVDTSVQYPAVDWSNGDVLNLRWRCDPVDGIWIKCNDLTARTSVVAGALADFSTALVDVAVSHAVGTTTGTSFQVVEKNHIFPTSSTILELEALT